MKNSCLKNAKDYATPSHPFAKGGIKNSLGSGVWGLSSGKGFTLIEVIVSMSIVAICLTLVMQLFSSGLTLSRKSCDFTRAVVHAKSKMEEMSLNPVRGSGEFSDGFRWEAEAEPSDLLKEASEVSGVNLFKINVKMFWFDKSMREHSVELVSLKSVIEEESQK